MPSSPAPKRRAASSERSSADRTTSAPPAGGDGRRSTSDTGADASATPVARGAVASRRADGTPGRRRARRRFSFVPTPAVLGAAVLVVAGGGAVIVSSSTAETGSPSSTYTPIAQGLGGVTVASSGRESVGAPVSRTFRVSRETLDRQAEQQAEQRTQALAQLVERTQERADELEADELANQWVLPVAGYRISATWGQVASYWSTYHTGLDFAAASGTPIVSVARGEVTYIGYDGAYGNKTEITLEDGTVIWYAHQTSQAVSVGQVVDPGELIGYVGSTGNVTGPHLHLEVRVPDGSSDGQDVDPYSALVEHGVTP